MKLKKVLVGLIAISVLSATVPAHAGNDTSWIPNDETSYAPTMHAFAFTDKLPLPNELSVLSAGTATNSYVCKSTADAVCAGFNYFTYSSILKKCDSNSETDCVASVSAIDANGTYNPATFLKYTVENHLNAFPADPVAGIPAGSMPSIWSIPSAPHDGGNQYAVYAGISGGVSRDGKNRSGDTFMQLALVPVVLKDFGKGRQSIAGGWSQSISGVYYDYCATSPPKDGNTFVDCAHVNGDGCVFATADQGMCYTEAAFGSIQKFNVQIRLSKEPTAWMHGRMVDPAISITQESAGGINLSVTAGATSVPMVYQNAAWASLSPAIQDLYVRCFSGSEVCGPFWFARASNSNVDWVQLRKTLAGNASINVLEYVNAFGQLPLEIMAAITPLIGNKSQAMSSTWSMRTLTSAEMSGANQCFTNTPGLKGIVTTNSVAYSAGPPEFKDGSLNYQVSSPHFNPDGITPFKGNYNLVMRSDVARCIYGFSNAPIKASISVLSSDGNNDVATSVAAEKDGWISLSANNFQFSAPVIQVKFSQDALVATPVVAPTLAPTVAPVTKPMAKAITITCVKGKTTKKVTSVKPTCPAGFKKK